MATVDEGVPTLDGEVPAGPVDGLEGRRGGVQAAGDQVDQRGGRQDHPAPSAFRIVVAAQRQRRAADDAARHRQRRRRRAAVACPSRRPPHTEKERKKQTKEEAVSFVAATPTAPPVAADGSADRSIRQHPPSRRSPSARFFRFHGNHSLIDSFSAIAFDWVRFVDRSTRCGRSDSAGRSQCNSDQPRPRVKLRVRRNLKKKKTLHDSSVG